MNTKFIWVLILILLTVLISNCSESNNRVTRDNYEQIKGDLTEQEIIAILGEPTEMSDKVTRGDPNLMWQKMIWRNSNTGDFIDIQFIGGQVQLHFYGNSNETYTGDLEGIGTI